MQTSVKAYLRSPSLCLYVLSHHICILDSFLFFSLFCKKYNRNEKKSIYSCWRLESEQLEETTTPLYYSSTCTTLNLKYSIATLLKVKYKIIRCARQSQGLQYSFDDDKRNQVQDTTPGREDNKEKDPLKVNDSFIRKLS